MPRHRLRAEHTTVMCTDNVARLPERLGRDHEEQTMPFVTAGDGTEIFYKDWGSGRPIMFHHGWPLSSDDRDAQLLFLVQHGYRSAPRSPRPRCSPPPSSSPACPRP